MNLNIDILQELNEIYQNRENACDLEGVFANFKQGRTIILTKAKRDETLRMNDYEVVINIADEIPSELLERLTKTVRDYMDEQYRKITQVQISNLPWDEVED